MRRTDEGARGFAPAGGSGLRGQRSSTSGTCGARVLALARVLREAHVRPRPPRVSLRGDLFGSHLAFLFQRFPARFPHAHSVVSERADEGQGWSLEVTGGSGILCSVCLQNVVDGFWRSQLAGTCRNRFGVELISDLLEYQAVVRKLLDPGNDFRFAGTMTIRLAALATSLVAACDCVDRTARQKAPHRLKKRGRKSPISLAWFQAVAVCGIQGKIRLAFPDPPENLPSAGPMIPGSTISSPQHRTGISDLDAQRFFMLSAARRKRVFPHKPY